MTTKTKIIGIALILSILMPISTIAQTETVEEIIKKTCFGSEYYDRILNKCVKPIKKEDAGLEKEKEIGSDFFSSDISPLTLDESKEKKENDLGLKLDKSELPKNASGANFKLNLDALTLTTKDTKGNIQKTGKSIFANKDYTAQYGVALGVTLYIIDIMIYVIGSLALVTMTIGGIYMITNHGDDAWVSKGKSMIFYSIIGVIAALLSFIIVNIVQTALA